jgi:pantoate--beta-alanine ligase
MIVLKLKDEVRAYIKSVRDQKQQIGFVATMGALHKGHLSLIETASKQNHKVVCSIFVNPLQFNDKKDFEKYPQTIDTDLALLKKQGCHMVFVPNVDEMYSDEDNTEFKFGSLDKVMEGVFRPGHFLGMAKVVKRLFDIVTPDRAYFGEKDFQQLAIIRKFTSDLKLPVKIIGCQIMREKDGLAMSSRNLLLTKKQRASAPKIIETLQAAKKWIPKLSVAEVKMKVAQQINEIPGFQLEYFEIADSAKLKPLRSWKSDSDIMGFIVVKLGAVRLIDNIVLIPKV